MTKRNEVVQFRVSPEEKAQLKERAGKDMSTYIRERLGLSNGDAGSNSLPASSQGGAGTNRSSAPVAEPPDLSAAVTTELEVAELARRLKNTEGLTGPVARREARKRLGL